MSEHCDTKFSQDEFCFEVPVTNLKAEANLNCELICKDKLEAIDNELSDLMESVERSGKVVVIRTDSDYDILLKTSPEVIDENKNYQVTNEEPLVVIEDSPKKKHHGGKILTPEINDKFKVTGKSLNFDDKDKEKNDPEISEIAHTSKDCLSVTTCEENKGKDDSGTENAAVINDISKENCTGLGNDLYKNDLKDTIAIDKDTINLTGPGDTIMDDISNKHNNTSENTIISNSSEQQNDLVTSTVDQNADEPNKSASIIILDENDSPKKNNNKSKTDPLIDNDAQNAIVTSTDEKIVSNTKNCETEINTIVLDDDDDVAIKTDVIDLDDCTVVEETAKDKKNNIRFIEYKEIFDESPLLTELVLKCLNFKNSKGMLRVINRTLIALYKNIDKTYKKSDDFQKAVKNTLQKLESEPQLKFSHIKNLCDEFKLHRTRRRVPLVTLDKHDRTAQPSNIIPPDKQIETIIDLDDDDNDGTTKKLEENCGKKNRIIINVPFEKDLSDFTYNDVLIQKDKELNSYEVPIVNDTDNIPIHQELTPIEIDDSGSDIVIGAGNYSDDDVILLDKSANNKRKKKTPTKSKPKQKRRRPCKNDRKELNHQDFNPFNQYQQVARMNNQSDQITWSNNQSDQIAWRNNPSDVTSWSNNQSGRTSLMNNQSDQVGLMNNQSDQQGSRNCQNYQVSNEINYNNQPMLEELLQPTKSTPRIAVKSLEVINKERIDVIEERIAYLKKRIDALEELEVSDDSSNSPYIRCEQFKATIVGLYKELCKLTGTELVKRHKVRLQVVPGHPEGPVRCLEKFLNDNIDEHGDPPFPDLQDVVHCVCEANRMYGMKWNRQQILNEAHALFSQYGQTVQKRRQKREYKDLMSLVKTEIVDPADSDPELQARLSANARIARKNESDLLERFANLEKGVIDQPDLGLRINNSGDSDDSDENNEEINMNEDSDKMTMNTATGEINTTINSGKTLVTSNVVTVGVETAFKVGSWTIVGSSNGLLSITPKISVIPTENVISPVIIAPYLNANLSSGHVLTGTKENPKISNVQENTQCGFQIFTHTTKSNTNAKLNNNPHSNNVLEENNIIIGEKYNEQIISIGDAVTEENIMEIETATEIANESRETKLRAVQEIVETEPISDIGLKITNVVTMSGDSTVDISNFLSDDIKIVTMDIDIDDNQFNDMDIVKTAPLISSMPETPNDDNEIINAETVHTSDNLTKEKATEIKNEEIKKVNDPAKPKPELPVVIEDSKVKNSALSNIDETSNETYLNILAKDKNVVTKLMTQFSMHAVVKLTPLDISSIQKDTKNSKSKENIAVTEAICSQIENVNANLHKSTQKVMLENINEQKPLVKDKEHTLCNTSGIPEVTDEETFLEILNIPGAENVSNESFVKENLIEDTNKNKDNNQVEDEDLKVKREPLDIPTMLESLGRNYTATIFDIEDPFMVIEISDSSDSDSEDEYS